LNRVFASPCKNPFKEGEKGLPGEQFPGSPVFAAGKARQTHERHEARKYLTQRHEGTKVRQDYHSSASSSCLNRAQKKYKA